MIIYHSDDHIQTVGLYHNGDVLSLT